MGSFSKKEQTQPCTTHSVQCSFLYSGDPEPIKTVFVKINTFLRVGSWVYSIGCLISWKLYRIWTIMKHSEKPSFVGTLASSHPQVIMSGWVVHRLLCIVFWRWPWFPQFSNELCMPSPFTAELRFTVEPSSLDTRCCRQFHLCPRCRGLLKFQGKTPSQRSICWLTHLLFLMSLDVLWCLALSCYAFGVAFFGCSLRQGASLGKALLTPQPGTRHSLGEIDTEWTWETESIDLTNLHIMYVIYKS